MVKFMSTSDKWKSKPHYVMPKKDPALMTLRESLEWEKDCLVKRIADMPAHLKPTYSEGYEKRIIEIDAQLLLTDEVLTATLKPAPVEIQSKIITTQPTAVKPVAKQPATDDLNPLLQSEIKKENKKHPKPEPTA